MDHIDYSRLAIVAKEFQTSISWVRANLKIVVPIKLLSDLVATLLGENAEEMMEKYVILNEEEEATQAAWEIDMEDNGGSPHESEIREYRKANWESMYDPWTYAPTILYPSSLGWKVKTLIRLVNMDGAQSEAVQMTVHPSTDRSDLAQMILCHMGYCHVGILSKLYMEYNGEMFGPSATESSADTSKWSTIASLRIPAPIVILCVDSTDWSFQDVD